MSGYGAQVSRGRTNFRVRSPLASQLWLCLFDGEREERLAMRREGEDWVLQVPRDMSGAPYGYRAQGEWAPGRGCWFDPAKLLVDPHAVEIDRRFVQHPALTEHGVDTAGIVPRTIIPGALPEVPSAPPLFERGGMIEVVFGALCGT